MGLSVSLGRLCLQLSSPALFRELSQKAHFLPGLSFRRFQGSPQYQASHQFLPQCLRSQKLRQSLWLQFRGQCLLRQCLRQ